MFELSVAWKYLIPRWRQLSVSIISIVSVLVIALVTWLIIVFFSVTNGLEKSWTQKLIALTAPVRVTPTEAYTKSYYFRSDSISADSNYTLMTIGEKARALETDPYDPEIDPEVPDHWPTADLDANGEVKDLVKLAFDGIQQVPGVTAHDFEMTFANVRLQQVREGSSRGSSSQAFISQASWLSAFDGNNPLLSKALVSPQMDDLTNLLHVLSLSTDTIQEDAPGAPLRALPDNVRHRLQQFFEHVTVTELRTPEGGWRLPRELLPAGSELVGCGILWGDQIQQVVIPQDKRGINALEKELRAAGYLCKRVTVKSDQKEFFLRLVGGITLQAELGADAIEKSDSVEDLPFVVTANIQGHQLHGSTPLGSLRIGSASFNEKSKTDALWLHQARDGSWVLPHHNQLGHGVLLAKHFRENDTRLGDRGYLAYHTPTASSVQEQRLPIYVAGFYDPGIIPVGGKFVMVDPGLTTLIRAAHGQQAETATNGINVWFDDVGRASEVKSAIEKELAARGIERYWQVETYRDYEFTHDLIQQLQSEKNLWSLIAIMIIIVACSNIITLLILLVNDKRLEIGILRSMGATSQSIAAIFGFCGMVMGMAGGLLGTLAAVITLHFLHPIISFISRMQGFDLFSEVFYGDILPNEISYQALTFVLVATTVISLIAGIIPAIKASLLKPTDVLRSE